MQESFSSVFIQTFEVKTCVCSSCSGHIEMCRRINRNRLGRKKVQVGNDQEILQSERNSHSKTRGGKKMTIRYLY